MGQFKKGRNERAGNQQFVSLALVTGKMIEFIINSLLSREKEPLENQVVSTKYERLTNLLEFIED